MIPAKKNKIFNILFKFYIKRLLRKHFYKIHISGTENLSDLNEKFPTIIYANHSNWWDGFIAYYITSVLWNKDDYLMMDLEQMRKYKFFKYVGVFSVERNDPQEVLKTVNYSASLLKDSDRYLWLFPQGGIQPQDIKPVKFLPGLIKIADRTGAVNLLPICFRYEFLLEQRPEIFIQINKPVIFETGKPVALADLENKFNNEFEELTNSIINQRYDNFKTVMMGKVSRNKTVDAVTFQGNS